MAQQNSGARTTAVKDEEEKKGPGVMTYVIGGLVGVAAGLLGSVLIDKTVQHFEAKEAAQQPRSGCCEDNSCAVCLDEANPTFRTRCCGQLIHGKCLEELKRNSISRCPFCRSRGWLG